MNNSASHHHQSSYQASSANQFHNHSSNQSHLSSNNFDNSHLHHHQPETSSVIDRILDFQLAFLPSFREFIESTWACFQFRYQLIPIRFPGEPCEENGVEAETIKQRKPQRKPQKVPSSVDLHGVFENTAPVPASTLMGNTTTCPGSSPYHSQMHPQPPRQLQHQHGRPCYSPCQCCSCRPPPPPAYCFGPGIAPRQPPRFHQQSHQEQQQRRLPFNIAKFQPCPQHCSIFDELILAEEGGDCNGKRNSSGSPYICTRASAINLQVQLKASNSSICIEESGDKRQNKGCGLKLPAKVKTCPSNRSMMEVNCKEECRGREKEDECTTTRLIKEGVELLKFGKKLVEEGRCHQAAVRPPPTCARPCQTYFEEHPCQTDILSEISTKLTDAMNGQICLLKEENEMLKLSNLCLHKELECLKDIRRKPETSTASINTEKPPPTEKIMTASAALSTSFKKAPPSRIPLVTSRSYQEGYKEKAIISKFKKSVEGAHNSSSSCVQLEESESAHEEETTEEEVEGVAAAESSLAGLFKDLPNIRKKSEATSASAALSTSGQRSNSKEQAALTQEVCSRLQEVECRVLDLESLCAELRGLAKELVEKLHRQEIRYHDTITKFDETFKMMKLMFEGLKSKTKK